MTKVLGISGSLRDESLNSALLRAARALAPDGMLIELADISQVPAYDADVQAGGFPQAVTRLARQIHDADAVLFATPEYNYSIPGVLKNAIDWISRMDPQPLDRKAIAIMGATMGTLGTARAQYHLRQVLVFLNGLVMNRPEVFVSSAHEKIDKDGHVTDDQTRAYLADFLEKVQSWVAAVGRMNNDPHSAEEPGHRLSVGWS